LGFLWALVIWHWSFSSQFRNPQSAFPVFILPSYPRG
jgi:hypothetical protein